MAIGGKEILRKLYCCKKFVMPKTHNFNKFQWFKFHIEKIGIKNTLCVYFGKFLSSLSLWKFAKKDIRDYIEQK